MRKLSKILLPVFLIFALCMVQMPSPVSAASYKIIGYVMGYPGSMDVSKLTHVNYAFGSISNSVVSANTSDLNALVALKSQNPNLKVILSIGGWGAEGFCNAASTDANRTTFANSCLNIINSTNIDGIDLDWEYPVNGGWGMIQCSPADKQNYTLLLQKIRNTIGYGKLLSIAAGASQEFINNTEITSIASICDYINLMTYDFGSSTHNANLYNTSTYSSGISCDSAVTAYLNAGVAASKINLGMPFYGRYGGNWPTYTDLVNNYINKNGWTRYWDDQAKACYLLNGGQFLTYDDPQTISYKDAYIKNRGLGGAMFWQYAQDSTGQLLGQIYSDLGGSGGGGGNPNPGTPYFMIVNRNSGKCLDLIGGDTSNGARINQWAYDYNGPNQRWAVLPTGDGHFKFISYVSGKSMSVVYGSLENEAQIHDWDYLGNPDQKWDFIDAGNGWYKIRNVNSGKMLDVAWASLDNDAKVQQNVDNGNPAEQWRLQPWGDYNIKTTYGKYVCVENCGSTNGCRIIQYDFQTNPWFKWRFENVGDGWYKVSSLNALTRVLCVKDGSYSAAYDCHLWDYNVNNYGDQKVRILPNTDGTFKFYFAHDGMSWDIPLGQTGNNVPLQQYPNNTGANQTFTLERVQ